ncbi:MAG: hypothetical protein IJQ17_06260 [Oscillospiraceae bacterium]|nr:hypothetical protein [Oscillospiraceae bacterium]
MKKQFIVISLFLAAMLLSACGAAPEAVTPAEEETAVETAAEPAPTEEPVAAEEPAADEHAASEETPAAPQQEPASAQQPETSATTSTPSSGGTSGGSGDNPTTPIIGVIGGGQSSGGTDQPRSGGVIGVIGSQQTHVHSYSRQVVAPTCSAGGYTIFTCSCGESYTSDYTSATGQHRWVMDYDYVPVYEERGIHICNVCGKDITDMTLEQHYFGDGCLGSWRSATIQVEVGTSYEVVGCHCEDCGKIRGE